MDKWNITTPFRFSLYHIDLEIMQTFQGGKRYD